MTIARTSNSEEHSDPKRVLHGLDLEDLRMTQDFASEVGVRRLIVTIPVRKPDRHSFFRIRPEKEFKLTVAIIEFKEPGETYIVHPNVAAQIPGETKRKMLTVGITREGILFVWPLPLPGPDGRQSSWHQSALMAAELAERRWIRLVANLELGAYDIYQAEAELAEPEWPALNMQQIIQVAFRERIIEEPEHPVLQRLRGQV